jgi:hypothetical protein
MSIAHTMSTTQTATSHGSVILLLSFLQAGNSTNTFPAPQNHRATGTWLSREGHMNSPDLARARKRIHLVSCRRLQLTRTEAAYAKQQEDGIWRPTNGCSAGGLGPDEPADRPMAAENEVGRPMKASSLLPKPPAGRRWAWAWRGSKLAAKKVVGRCWLHRRHPGTRPRPPRSACRRVRRAV